jgi:hypothetical protein
MSWKPAATNDLQRQVDTLAIKLLRANSELRLKTVYCQRLEFPLHQRLETIDALNAKLEQAREQNRRLEGRGGAPRRNGGSRIESDFR